MRHRNANFTYYLPCFLLNQPSVLFRFVFLGSILMLGFFCCVFLNFFLSIVGDRDCYSWLTLTFFYLMTSSAILVLSRETNSSVKSSWIVRDTRSRVIAFSWAILGREKHTSDRLWPSLQQTFTSFVFNRSCHGPFFTEFLGKQCICCFSYELWYRLLVNRICNLRGQLKINMYL